jgi:hypothetical protein
MPTNRPQDHALWPAFEEFCEKFGISSTNEREYENWWECFCWGAEEQAAHMIQTGPDVLGKDEED